MSFKLIDNPSYDDEKPLRKGLYRYNQSQIGDYDIREVVIQVLDEHRNVVGGLSGTTCWQWGYIVRLWLDVSLRGKGIGTSLIEEFTQFCKKTNCIGIRVETTSFQAKGFYQKNGFTLFGEIADYPPNYTCYFLSKLLKKID